VKRLLTAAAILGLVALMLPATTGIVLGQDDGPTGSITFVKVIDNWQQGQGTAPLDEFTFTYSGDPGNGTAENGTTVPLPFGSYTVGEPTFPNYFGHVADFVSCVPTAATDAPVVFSPTAVLNVDHPDWTCTVHNMYSIPIFQKVIVGGTATLGDFTFAITQGSVVTPVLGNSLDPASDGKSGIAYWGALVGPYTISETAQPANYVVGYSAACTGSDLFPLGDVVPPLCVITNTYVPPTIPPLPYTTTCGGTVTFTGMTPGWTLYIDNAAGLFQTSGTLGPISETVGTHTYQLSDDTHETIIAEGSFSISACYVPPPVVTVSPSPSPSPSVSPSPSPSPSVSPSPSPSPVVTPRPTPKRTPNGGGVGGAGTTPPPTSAIGAASTGSDSPLVPLSIALLLIAATGLVFVRRPKSR
jgi:hypothetical protein